MTLGFLSAILRAPICFRMSRSSTRVGGQLLRTGRSCLSKLMPKTRLFNVSTRVAFSGGTFSSYVQVDDDQAFLLDGLDTTLGGSGGNYGVRCDATICNPIVYAPGPFATFPGVGWLKHLNLALQCGANGIDWQSGNTVRISDSVIEAYAQYGVRGGTRRGGFGGFELANVYEEVGNCANPQGAIGQAGVIAQGNSVKVQGGEAP